jgi:hypothetical protein
MPLKIIDRDFNLLAELDDYESLIFTRRWRKPGDFHVTININKQHTAELQKENFIMLAKHLNKAGVIRHREIKTNETGNEVLMIQGSTISGLLSRRITLPPIGAAYDHINAAAEDVMKHYVTANAVNSANSDRIIPYLAVALSQARGANISWNSRLKNLDEELEAISGKSGLGWDIYLDIVNMRYIFEIYAGRDLTTGQSINSPVIFSSDFDNLKEESFTDSDLNYSNYAYVGGQGEGELREIAEVGTDTGLDRREVFIDARDISNPSDLIIRGEEKLLDVASVQNFQAKVMPSASFRYEEDWNLGDKVTIQNKKWGITMDAVITEVKEVYEPSGFKLEVVFGNSMPTLIRKIKQEFKQLLPEITK